MGKGTYRLTNGTRIEAGIFNTSAATAFQRHNFKQNYSTPPVVMASIASYNGTQTVTGRIKSINRTGFHYLMQEEEAQNNGHMQETISYIAWDRSDGTADGITYSVGVRGGVTNVFRRTTYRKVNSNAFQNSPFIVTDMLTANGTDVASVRSRHRGNTGIEFQIEEEKSYDSETSHSAENVGYIAVMK
jgi:hypothetical protein